MSFIRLVLYFLYIRQIDIENILQTPSTSNVLVSEEVKNEQISRKDFKSEDLSNRE